ncbi:hypothetical protein ARMGADRAFT_1037785 [Armillaria gallica]|uniref:Uncharacterized protein n=1 Tax=Armillaria gallica TaxID=47427 RepID=A0A2H3CYP6_ARMGA|nr:hypothetical protein ARMGADRAFT_1037785 [Armillaria gallica]
MPLPSPEPESRVQAPVLPRTIAPLPAPKPTTPPPPKEKMPALRQQQSMAPVAPQHSVPQRTPDLAGSVPRLDLLVAKSAANPSSSNIRTSGSLRVNIAKPPLPRFMAPSMAQKMVQPATSQRKVMPNPSDSSKAFQKDWTSPLHSKPAQQLKIGPPVNTTQSEVLTRASSRALAVDAAARTNIIRGPDPNLGPLREGNIVIPSSDRQPLFFPGTDDKEERIQEDLDKPMDFDKDEPLSDDEEMRPPPTNIARRLCQEPRISFVFDEITGDFVESHPTIFLPRPTVPPASSQDLRRSARSHSSPVNPDAAYLKAIQGSKADAKKKKNKDAKGKDQATEAKAPRKHARTEDNATQLKDKPAFKKPKLKETIIIDEDEYMAQDFQDRRLLP